MYPATYTPRHLPRMVGLGAPALVFSLALGACGHAPPVGFGEPVVVALTATALEPPPTLPPAAVGAVRAAITAGGGSLQVLAEQNGRAVTVDQRDLVLRRGAEVEHDAQRRGRLTDALLTEVGATIHKTAGQGRLDLLGLLTEVGRLPGPATVIVQSSGLQTVAPLDLATTGWDFEPRATADAVATRGYLPDLHGKDVTFAGLGQVAGAQRPLPTPLRQRLADLWTAICTRAGAHSCTVDDRPLPAGTPSGAPGATVPVPVPVSDSIAVSGGGWAALPTDLLFGPDSADLLPGAEAELDPLVAAVNARGGTVDLVGHTASVGPAEGARALSRQRAETIAAALVRGGVPPTRIGTVRGLGFDEPLPGDATANRAVVATVRAGAE